jgi:hypothetical protein
MLTVNLRSSLVVLVSLLTLTVTVVLWAYSQHDSIKSSSNQDDKEVVRVVNKRSDELFVLKSSQSRLQAITESQSKQLDSVQQKVDIIDSKLDTLILRTR